jgi:tetratricopeptide (TPR) repeat protein
VKKRVTLVEAVGPRLATLLLLAAIFAGCSAEARKARHLELGDRYFKAGEYEKAKIEYLNVLRGDFNNAIAESQLGLIWFEQGAPLRAYPYLSKSRELASDNIEARTKLAMVLASLGEPAAAKEEALAILQRSPGQEEALLVLINMAWTEQELEEVQEQLRKIPQENDTAYHLAWASLAVRKGDLSYAQSELEEALKLEPKSPRVHLAMATLNSVRQDLDKAGEEFQTAAELSPPRSDARLKYAEYERQIGNLDKATLILKEITRQVPDYLSAWCLLAEMTLTEKKYDEALSILENVLTRDPQNLEGLILQAQVWLGQGEATKAVGQLERLARAYPSVPLIDYHFARACLADNNPTEAAAALNEAIAAKPDYTEAILLLGELNLRTANAPLVVPAMLGLLKQQPDLVSAQSLLAEAYRALERFDDAAAIIHEQIRAAPQSPDGYLRLGLIFRQQDKIDEARKAFEQALELAPNDLSAAEQLVELDISQKNFEAATQRVQRKLENEPNSAGAYFIYGKIYATEGEWDHAVTVLHKALDLDPNFSRAFDLLISTYISADNPAQAIDELQTLLSKSPDNTRALADLAMIYERVKDYPKARDTYEKLLSITPNSAAAMNNLAYLYAERFDQLDKAYELARKARALQPRDPLIADTLGWTFYRRADYQEALVLLRESAGKLPDNASAQFHFGMASYMMGETDAAEKALRRALSADADLADKPEAQRRLTFLENGTGQDLTTEQLTAVTQKQADDVVAWMRLGGSYEKEGAFAKAAGAYEEALKVNPELLPAAITLAQLNAGPLQNKNTAFDFAKRARDLAPNNPQVAGILGEIVYQLSNFSWAYSLLQESARQLTGDAKILQDYAWTAYSLGRVSEARSIMQRAMEAHPDPAQSSDAKSFLAMTALEQNPELLAKSEAEIQKILATNPRHVPALLAQADLQVQRGDAKPAATTYNDVLRRYPDFAPAQKRLASLYVEDPAHIDEAYSLALKARNTLPDDPELAKILGEISYKRKEFAYAIQLFQETARRKPLRGIDLYYLGMSQLRASQDSESKKTLEQALTAGLQEPLLGEAKAAITELRRREDL